MKLIEKAKTRHMPSEVLTLSTEQQLIAQYIIRRAVNSKFDGRETNHPIALKAHGGSGKTHTLRVIGKVLDHIGVRYAVIAFTGRAAAQIGKEGIPARTCHSLLKEPVMDEDGNLKRWVDRDPRDVRDICGSVVFVDECSMIPESLHDTLMSIGVLVVYIGDDDQQPPILSPDDDPDFETFRYVKKNPNGITLEMTHNFRQAAGSKIADACYHIRTTNTIPTYEPSSEYRTIRQSDVFNLQFHKNNQYDLMICGKNATRKRLNRLARTARGFDDPEVAMVGETVMCLSNDMVGGTKINNGELFEVEWMVRGETVSSFALRAMDRAIRVTVKVHNDCWLSEAGPRHIEGSSTDNLAIFGFGYASTSYKIQGSQADSVLMLDEDVSFFLDRRKYRYTCASRARQHLTIAI